ncbi:unnamed protein product [Effrenium voratum]|nr:unnamed protein product [Effrenium voratum]
MYEATVAVRKVTTFFNNKIKELEKHTTGPLSTARADLSKLRPKASTQGAEVQKLRGKVNNAKKEFAKVEAAEKTAHLEAKERREAAAILKTATAELEPVEAQCAKITDSAAELLAAKGEDLQKFATPCTVLEGVEKSVLEAASALSKVKASLTEETKKIKATKGPLMEAKKELAKLNTKADSLMKKNNATLQAARAACKTISESGATKASEALRAEAQKRSLTADGLFAELAGGADRLPHEKLAKCLLGLGLELPEEHAKLICRKVEAGSISKRSFQSFVQRYYVVTTAREPAGFWTHQG